MSVLEVSTRVLREWTEVAALAEQWNKLATQSDTFSVFQSYEWHEAWWRNFGGDYDLRVVVAMRGDSLVGVAPMMVSSGRMHRRRRRILRFLGTINYASDYCDFLLPDDGSGEDVLSRLLDEISRDPTWDIMELARFPTHSAWRAATEAKLRAIVPMLSTSVETEAPCRILRDPEQDRAIVNSKSFKRDTNWLQKRGTLQLEQAFRPEDEQDVLARLDDFFKQHIERRSLAGDVSQFLDPRQKQFYRDLVPALLARAWLRFATLKWNDISLGYHYGFEFNNKFCLYKPTFNVEYAKQAPGKVMLKFLIEDAVDRGLTEFDFTVGEEPYKYRFSNLVRTNTRFHAFRSRFDGLLALLADRVVKPLIPRVRAAVARRRAATKEEENE